MANFQKQIAEMTKSIQKIEEEASELSMKAFDLRQKREELIAQMILDERLLSDTDWDLSLDGQGAHLSYKANSPNDMKVIKELARTDYHSWFEISDGIQLRFDDNDISLSFKESKQVMPFAKRNGLRINGTGLKDKLSKLKRDVAALETICHQFGL